MINRIVFCTLRDNKGATGGPGGVLFLQKELIGDSLTQYKCEYWFRRFRINRFGRLVAWLNRSSFYLKALFTRNAFYVTHDIDSAYILNLLKKKYSVIYHHQGPLIEEITNLKNNLSDAQKKSITRKESIAFSNAVSVHFPSKGAADMYFDSKYTSIERDKVRVGKPLFNIILPKPVVKPEVFDLKKEPDTLTFFSLGTLTIAKGQDQVVKFLEEFLKHYQGKSRYIIVGKGPLKDALVEELKVLDEKYPSFSYRIIDAMPHEQVMYLHQLADVYIMLHRISIFDFATLEAMSQSSAIVLSKVGGNLDFDKEKNILFAEDYQGRMEDFVKTDLEALKTKNKAMFDKYFSISAFKEQYVSFVDTIVRPLNNV